MFAEYQLWTLRFGRFRPGCWFPCVVCGVSLLLASHFPIFDEQLKLFRRCFAFGTGSTELGTLSEEPFAEYQLCAFRFGGFRPG